MKTSGSVFTTTSTSRAPWWRAQPGTHITVEALAVLIARWDGYFQPIDFY